MVPAGDVAATWTEEGRIEPYAATVGIVECLWKVEFCCVVGDRYWYGLEWEDGR